MAKSKQIFEYKVFRDSREKEGHGWIFDIKDGSGFKCLGTEVKGLDTGDYTIEGFEDILAIERKRSTQEIAINMWEPRFEDELKRLEGFKYPFLICEFDYRDVAIFPINSGIPQRFQHKTKMTADIMQKTFARYQVQYKTKIIFAGSNGKAIAEQLFYYVAKYGKT